MSPRRNLHVIRGKISQSKCHPPPAVLGWALMVQRPISVKWSSMQGLSKGQNNFHLRIWYGERRNWGSCAASLGFDAHWLTQLLNKCQNRKIKQWLGLCFQSRFIWFCFASIRLSFLPFVRSSLPTNENSAWNESGNVSRFELGSPTWGWAQRIRILPFDISKNLTTLPLKYREDEIPKFTHQSAYLAPSPDYLCLAHYHRVWKRLYLWLI